MYTWPNIRKALESMVATACGSESSGQQQQQRDPGQDGRGAPLSYFDEERNEVHPECWNCTEVLKNPPPTTCTLCKTLNFPSPARTPSPGQRQERHSNKHRGQDGFTVAALTRGDEDDQSGTSLDPSYGSTMTSEDGDWVVVHLLKSAVPRGFVQENSRGGYGVAPPSQSRGSNRLSDRTRKI